MNVFALLTGVTIALTAVVLWQLHLNAQWSYAAGYDDARVNGMSIGSCDLHHASRYPLLSNGRMTDLDAWHRGCIDYVTARENTPPRPLCSIGCPGPAGSSGTTT